MRSGILLLDKPRGLSSNAALQRVRTLLERVKAGHVGSLDPLATGMLPICLGEATKVAGDISAARKRYRFSVAARLEHRDRGCGRDGDRSAPPCRRSRARGVEAVLERNAAAGASRFRRCTPRSSARGSRSTSLARAGVTVERARARRSSSASSRLLTLSGASLELEVLCSKGTYVRVLAEDIAARARDSSVT